MNAGVGLVAVLTVSVFTLAIGVYGVRVSRTTSDFYVASRSVGPVVNASAISGEYLSAASFLGAAGLILAQGADALWYSVGWTAGYLVLLVLVAAPLRRSGAYTLSDFAELRLESQAARKVSSVVVALIGVLYLLPQFQGAGLTLRTLVGAPTWTGSVLVAAVVLVIVLSGGMRSITLTQAFQYWLKLTALIIPLAVLLAHWRRTGGATPPQLHMTDWVEPMQGRYATYLVYSLMVATFLGTMGLPHVVARFYTNIDGRAARRTTLGVLGLLSVFYLLPTMYGVLGRIYSFRLVESGRTDAVVLELPTDVLHGFGADLLTGLLGAGAFAAFLSTSSGLAVSVAGVLSQDVLRGRSESVRDFRLATALVVSLTLALLMASSGVPVARAVELAFAVAASTFCPLLLLGIWWRGLTAPGAITGLVVGGVTCTIAVVAALAGYHAPGVAGPLLAQPAAWTTPLALAVMIVVSLATADRRPPGVMRTMVRLHTPEHLDLDRGSFDPDRSSRPTVQPGRPTAHRRDDRRPATM
ncbi:cation acetate symporter [Flexivirga oryzae]|uniref:Na+(H+)/acetate symporter ActP n=1 Tax=Flexivirga oryzae TaxID=1794944 RepID=A0A839N8R4_9MICO|nr:cation acetate symporter [Flexivirga oryzae]MBB2892394.1 Na+(H+)/acetate symporter ActP [Flexivirga oryzae]